MIGIYGQADRQFSYRWDSAIIALISLRSRHGDKSLKYIKVKRERSTSDARHYVRNADLLPAVIEAKELGRVTQRLSDLFWKIAENYSRKHNFIRYSYRDDMVGAAVANLCQNALKFDHNKYNNPFAYYTTAIHNSFLQFIADEKKHAVIRDKLLIQAGANASFGYEDRSRDNGFDSDEMRYADEPDLDQQELDLSKGEDSLTSFDNVKIQHRARIPGPVTRYGPGDFEVCPVTGNFILKKKEEPVIEAKPARKPRAKKVDVVEAPVKTQPVKPAKAKKAEPVAEVPVKKTRKKAEPVAETKPAKKVAAKKTVAKKEAKPATKKTVAKKATKKGA